MDVMKAYDGRNRPVGSNADEWELFLTEHAGARTFIASQISGVIEALERQVFVPGLWRCPKCDFHLVQSTLYAATGNVRPRDDPGDKCPNCNVLLWRVSERQNGKQMADRCEEQMARAVAAEALIDKIKIRIFPPSNPFPTDPELALAIYNRLVEILYGKPVA